MIGFFATECGWTLEDILGHTREQLDMIMSGIVKLRKRSSNEGYEPIRSVNDLLRLKSKGLPIRFRKGG